ncbi:multiple sugar transport system substrate-binding protein [Actinoplanes campanulatus]|uniref:Multiple sugar transport system substrate-binding protein n=1 Tax=Actinoplanes campanulatus TaxID=113559 RepID=A0A7W5ART2_9ACTN|nr:extracellular solute-binding protein [Actinoplanes campanulatus]MBB3101252.1 multiple sugar transport system substrate-binding protein [Actinoplanes campanulatus]GGN51227.1 sugar ABC transporter substrate-binding protein [Actinoplanes campanulatus]GID42135.1 sugar ABC transporter substrate-binding protein [Actinoplanes campanulatus]
MNAIGNTAGPTRRHLLTLAGLTATAATLSGCGRGFGGGGDDDDGRIEINMVWWGDAQRAQFTQKSLDLFQTANPGIRVRTEYQDSSPYKDKLAARFAAGDPPDLMAMRFDSLREYADRGTLLDLAKHAGALDLTGLTEPARALGQVGPQIFGVPSGLNTISFVVDKTITDQYGVSIPDGDTWTWADLSTFAAAVTKASGGKVYGANFEPWTVANLLVFARQRGEDFFTADGRLGATAGTITAWFELTEGLRAAKAFPPAGFIDQNNGASPAQSYLAKKSIAAQIIPSNNLLGYNQACGGNLVMLRIPGETARRGQSIDTPALWSIAATSKHPDETLKLLNFLINDVEAARVSGATRGVPPNRKIAEQIAPDLDADNKRATEFLSALQNEKLPPSYPYPVGASKLTNILKTISTEVEFGRLEPAAAGERFITEARKEIHG